MNYIFKIIIVILTVLAVLRLSVFFTTQQDSNYEHLVSTFDFYDYYSNSTKTYRWLSSPYCDYIRNEINKYKESNTEYYVPNQVRRECWEVVE